MDAPRKIGVSSMSSGTEARRADLPPRPHVDFIVHPGGQHGEVIISEPAGQPCKDPHCACHVFKRASQDQSPENMRAVQEEIRKLLTLHEIYGTDTTKAH